jgi:hypothetical protein
MKHVLAAGGMVAVLTYSIALIARAEVVQTTIFGERPPLVCPSPANESCDVAGTVSEPPTKL